MHKNGYVLAFLSIFILLLAILKPTPARAQDWDGFDQFERILSHSDISQLIEFSEKSPLHWKKLPPAELFLIVAPKKSLNPDVIKKFVDNGGTLIIIDDFGSTSELYLQMDAPIIFAHDWQSDRLPTINNNPALPVLNPPDKTTNPIFKNVHDLAFNHPKPAYSNRHTLLGSQNFGYIYAWNIEKGRIFSILDASFATNLMLSTLDNARFLQNLLTVACAHRQVCRAIYVHGDFPVQTVSPFQKRLTNQWNKIKNNAEKAYAHLSAPNTSFPWKRFAAFLAVLFFIVFAILFLPWKRE